MSRRRFGLNLPTVKHGAQTHYQALTLPLNLTGHAFPAGTAITVRLTRAAGRASTSTTATRSETTRALTPTTASAKTAAPARCSTRTAREGNARCVATAPTRYTCTSTQISCGRFLRTNHLSSLPLLSVRLPDTQDGEAGSPLLRRGRASACSGSAAQGTSIVTTAPARTKLHFVRQHVRHWRDNLLGRRTWRFPHRRRICLQLWHKLRCVRRATRRPDHRH